MPRQVDHDERRSVIAAAVLGVVADRGLEAVSLRNVAAEAGVSTGMVQHYFPSKRAMVQWAMSRAAAGFGERMSAALRDLGENATPRETVGAVLSTLLPDDEQSAAEARVALAFMSRATTRPEDAARLAEGAGQLRGFLESQVRAAPTTVPASRDRGLDPSTTAVLLLALADGLAAHMISSGLPRATARHALDEHLDLLLGPV